jgi:hypothetical protein
MIKSVVVRLSAMPGKPILPGPEKGRLFVKWGDAQNSQCYLNMIFHPINQLMISFFMQRIADDEYQDKALIHKIRMVAMQVNHANHR